MSGYQIYILCLTICSIGVPNTISKMVAERIGRKDEYNAKVILKVSFYIFGIIGFIGSLGMYFGAEYISNNILKIKEAEYTLIALAPSIFFVSINSVFRGYFNGKKMISISSKTQLNEQLIKTIVTIILVEIVAVFSKNNTKVMASVANIGTTIATIITFIYIVKIYFENSEKGLKKVKKEKTSYIIKEIFYLLIPLSLTSLISALNKNIDSVTVVRILEKIYGNEIAKIKYGILSSKIDLLITMPLAFNISIATVLIPEISSSRICNNFENIKNKIITSLLISIVISLPCFIGMFLYSNEIIYLLFPKASLGGELLKIASISIIFSSLIQTINAALQGLNYIKIPIITLIIGAIIKLILNIVLIPMPLFYEKGAVVSTVISNIITFIISFYNLIKVCDLKINVKELLFKPIIATFIMGIISYLNYILLKKAEIYKSVTIIFVIVISIVVYFITIFRLKIIKFEEFNEYFIKKRLKY